MSTKLYETCILYPGMTPLSADAMHSPDAAVALVRTLALKHYRYLGDGTYWDLRALKFGAVSTWEISTQLLSIHASTSGALLGNSAYVTFAALFGRGFQRRVAKAFPGAHVFSVVLNDQINDFAFAAFGGNEQRRLWSISQEGADCEEGEVLPEELSALRLTGAKRALSRRSLDEEDQVVVGGETYDLDSAQRYFELVVQKLQERYIEPSGWDHPGGCSWLVRRPCWRIRALKV
jgi:hypothetical protein